MLSVDSPVHLGRRSTCVGSIFRIMCKSVKENVDLIQKSPWALILAISKPRRCINIFIGILTTIQSPIVHRFALVKQLKDASPSYRVRGGRWPLVRTPSSCFVMTLSLTLQTT